MKSNESENVFGDDSLGDLGCSTPNHVGGVGFPPSFLHDINFGVACQDPSRSWVGELSSAQTLSDVLVLSYVCVSTRQSSIENDGTSPDAAMWVRVW